MTVHVELGKEMSQLLSNKVRFKKIEKWVSPPR